MKARVLVVDDEPRMAESICTALERCGYECFALGDAASALDRLAEKGADLLVTDWRMPGMDGLELLARVRELEPALPVVVVTAFADVSSAVEAMRRGAFDYVAKPFDNDELRSVAERALELTRLHRQNRYLRQELQTRHPVDAIVAESPSSRRVLELVRRVAPSRSTVMIEGESGTGKELVARSLHYWSERVGEPFVAINCAALAEGVLESELFGHERGAFTGATAERQGCFERAHRGTLFLDEIGEVGPEFQAKLLRVVQEGEVTRVGGQRARAVDVRLVTATNRELRREVEAGRFREDLYFRLNVIPIRLDGLRQRVEDILPLAESMLARHADERGRRLGLTPAARELLLAHSWPGNVRELENAVERAVVLARGELIHPQDLLLERDSSPAGRGAGSSASGDPELGLQAALERTTERTVRKALVRSGGRRQQAARLLGVERTTLYRLIKRYGIDG